MTTISSIDGLNGTAAARCDNGLAKRFVRLVRSNLGRMEAKGIGTAERSDLFFAGLDALAKTIARHPVYPLGRFKAIARTQIHNAMVREVSRSNGRRRVRPRIYIPVDEGLADQSDYTGPEKLEREELLSLLERLVVALPKQRRRVIVMNFYEDMTQTEIGEVVGQSVAAICRTRRSALLDLKERLTRLSSR